MALLNDVKSADVQGHEKAFDRDVFVTGVDSLKLKLAYLSPEILAALAQVVREEAIKMRDLARSLASGKEVKVRTGRFLESIKEDVRVTSTSVTGRVYSDDPRAPLFDYGGVQAAREILPNVAKAMHFMGSAGAVFAAVVHRPEVVYPAHPVIHEAFNEMEADQVTDRGGYAFAGNQFSSIAGGLPERLQEAARSHIFDMGQGV